jgi:hypothetical protein
VERAALPNRPLRRSPLRSEPADYRETVNLPLVVAFCAGADDDELAVSQITLSVTWIAPLVPLCIAPVQEVPSALMFE